MPASKLPKEYIGIDTEKQKPEELKMTEAEVEAAAKAKAEAEAKTATEAEAKAAPEGETTPEATESEIKEELPTLAEGATASTEATPKAELSKEDEKKLGQLMLDLRWLITEGYVTEYGDGRLFAAPPMPEAKPKELKARTPKAPKATPVAQVEAAPVAEAAASVVEEPEAPKLEELAPETDLNSDEAKS
jgi:hypothetical protein